MKRFIIKMRRQAKAFLDANANQQLKKSILEALPFWIASLITGICAVAYTKLFALSEEMLQLVLAWHAWIIFFITPLCFATAWYIVNRFAPNARGSGIPQVIASIELMPRYEKKVSALLSFRIIIVKIISSMFMVAGGGAIGREGPTIQIAGSVFRLINKAIPQTWPRQSQKSFILTGAAAGLAAAFNTPLGGIVFAIEELAKIHISHFRTALFTAIIIAGLAAQSLHGPYLYLGYPNVSTSHWFVLPAVVAVAIVAGILGAAMCKIILKIMKFKQSFKIFRSLMYAVITGLIIASIAYFISPDVMGSGKSLINHALFTQDKYMSVETMIIRIVGPILSFNVGGAGGIFAPALSAGATVGSVVSELFELTGADVNILILAGMVAFLTGVTRTPFTSAILVLEMTDRHGMIFYLMLGAMMANIAALAVDKKSLYDHLKHIYMASVKQDPV